MLHERTKWSFWGSTFWINWSNSFANWTRPATRISWEWMPQPLRNFWQWLDLDLLIRTPSRIVQNLSMTMYSTTQEHPGEHAAHANTLAIWCHVYARTCIRPSYMWPKCKNRYVERLRATHSLIRVRVFELPVTGTGSREIPSGGHLLYSDPASDNA